MLSDLEDLIEEVKPHFLSTIRHTPMVFGSRSGSHFPIVFDRPVPWISKDKIYCPACTKDRRVKVDVLLHTGPLCRLSRSKPISNGQFFSDSEWGPSLLVFTCEQCSLQLNCLVYDEFVSSKPAPKLAVFPTKVGGLSTSNTPPEVKHFVDQAYLCQCLDAHGAAVEMYRAALEQLLHLEGYEEGMLNSKIKALELDRNKGTAKPWAFDLDTEMLQILRKLGNEVAHPKDVTVVSAFNSETIIGIQEVFQFLLADIYERSKEEGDLISDLVDMRDRS
ncbi:MAG: DUF4145 domain-containing protein [Candidatus Obscuribacterales bacterium]|nr:DUF4145 domain-containing protein [Candidatus Obscuribacterales bacterium]